MTRIIDQCMQISERGSVEDPALQFVSVQVVLLLTTRSLLHSAAGKERNTCSINDIKLRGSCGE